MNLFDHPRFSVLASFLTGFSVMVIELISSRIVAPIIGSSVYTWTSVIGLTLMGLAVGGFLGGRLADRISHVPLLPALFFFSGTASLGIPILATHTSFITSLSDSLLILNLLVSFFLFFLPATLLGTIQPVLLKRYAHEIADLGERYGSLSAAWSVGSMVGVFLTGFYFISAIGSKETIGFVACLLLVLGGLFSLRERHVIQYYAASLAVLALIAFLSTRSNGSTAIIYEEETDYYLARVVDAQLPLYGDARILFLDFDTHSIESEAKPVPSYTDLVPLFGLLTEPINRILVIGAGAYTMPKSFKTTYREAHVTVLETDPALERIAQRYFGLGSYEIETRIGDARLSLSKDDARYDVIFGDAYNSYISVPWHLLTEEWNKTVREHLTDDGVYALNFIGTLRGPGSDFAQSIARTMRSSFPHLYLIAFGGRPEDIQNVVLIGSRSESPMSEDSLRELLLRSGNPELAVLVQDASILEGSALILTDDFSPVERLMQPIQAEYFPTNHRFVDTLLGNG